MTLNTFMKVSITRYKEDSLDLSHGYVYVSVNSSKLELSCELTLSDAEAEMEKLKKRLNTEPTYIDRGRLVYIELYGFLD